MALIWLRKSKKELLLHFKALILIVSKHLKDTLLKMTEANKKVGFFLRNYMASFRRLPKYICSDSSTSEIFSFSHLLLILVNPGGVTRQGDSGEGLIPLPILGQRREYKSGKEALQISVK